MLSLLVLVLHVVVLASPLRRLLLKRTDPDNEGASVNAEEPGMPTSLAAEVRKHVSELGGSTVFLYLSLRFLGSLLLLGLSVASLVSTEAGRQAHAGSGEGLFSTLGKWGKKHRRRHRGEAFTMHEWLQVAMCMTFVRLSFNSQRHKHLTVSAVIHVISCSRLTVCEAKLEQARVASPCIRPLRRVWRVLLARLVATGDLPSQSPRLEGRMGA